jgi:ATP-binding cassette subfamily F protein 3
VQYLGNYEDYLAKKAADLELKDSGHEGKAPGGPASPRTGGEREEQPRKRKVNPYRIQALTQQIESIEAAIQTYETRIAVLGKMLASEELYRDYTLFRSTMEEHDRLQAELARYMEDWEKLQTELSALQAG